LKSCGIVNDVEKSKCCATSVFGKHSIQEEMSVELILVGKPNWPRSLPPDGLTAAIAGHKSSGPDSFWFGALTTQDALQGDSSGVAKVDVQVTHNLSDLRVNLKPLIPSFSLRLVEDGIELLDLSCSLAGIILVRRIIRELKVFTCSIWPKVDRRSLILVSQSRYPSLSPSPLGLMSSWL